MDIHLLLHSLADKLQASGLDIVQPFSVATYNAERKPQTAALPDFGRQNALCILIGNSNALWPAFVQHICDKQISASASGSPSTSADDPLDQYCEQAMQSAIHSALSSSSTQPSHTTFLGHTMPGQPGFVDMLSAAQCSGLAYLNNALHLCVSPTYGAWFALRAVVVLDMDVPLPHADASHAADAHARTNSAAAPLAEGSTALKGGSCAPCITRPPMADDPFPALRPALEARVAALMQRLTKAQSPEEKPSWKDWAAVGGALYGCDE